MKIHFEQSGGFVAGVRRPPVTIDTDTVPSDEAQAWHDLVNSADFFNLPASSTSPAARDAFSYRVTVESGSNRHTVQLHGGSVPAVLSPLIERLRQAGRPQAN